MNRELGFDQFSTFFESKLKILALKSNCCIKTIKEHLSGFILNEIPDK